ncbi:MAG: hypothetical protein CM15mP106_6740 [Candidatus Neomarinimicrobiota bacterium]|nr:MAG: hypothetical protein CM15mP106_6740 [Candidatus Neomarinimicrobiota bacterium]
MELAFGYRIANGLSEIFNAVCNKFLNSFPFFGAARIKSCMHRRYERSKAP